MDSRLHHWLAAGLSIFALSGCTGEDTSRPPGTAGGATIPSNSAFTSEVRSAPALALASYWQPVPDDGVELGLGWDSREGRIVPNRCVHMAPVHSPGQTTELSLDEVTSRSEVMSALKVSAAASVKTMFASGSATASFAKSTKASSQSTTLLMNATITNGTLFAGPADAAAVARSAFPANGIGGEAHGAGKDRGRLTLQPWAMKLLNKPADFRAYCGDGYISAITSGARLLASFEITANSASSRQAIATSIKGSYGPANVSGSSNASKGEEKSQSGVSVRYMQVGGAKGAIATSNEGLRKKLETLANEAFESPHFQDMRVTPYAQMAEVRGAGTWREADDEYEMIADTYWQLTSLEDDVRVILANYAEAKDANTTAGYVARTGRDKGGLRDFLDDILHVRRAIHAALSGAGTEVSQSPADDPAVKLFAVGEAQTVFRAPSGINLGQLSQSRDLGTLARSLNQALPYGNPSVLLINLPLPVSELPTATVDDEALRKAVVDYYVAPASRRACLQDPNDRNCFSNRQLEEIAALVPLRPASP